MKQEIDLIHASRQFELLDADLVPVDATFARMPPEDVNPHRAVIRQATDAFIIEGLQAGDTAKVATAACATMLNVAEVLVAAMLDPMIDDFVDGAQALLETARSHIDRGLMLRDAATVTQGACMIEIAIRGACAALGIDYERVLPLVHSGDEEALVAYFKAKRGTPNE